jgi:hypothetical protein
VTALSSDGGGIAAEQAAARPVQVLSALRPGVHINHRFGVHDRCISAAIGHDGADSVLRGRVPSENPRLHALAR